MSLQLKITALAQAIALDVKQILARVSGAEQRLQDIEQQQQSAIELSDEVEKLRRRAKAKRFGLDVM